MKSIRRHFFTVIAVVEQVFPNDEELHSTVILHVDEKQLKEVQLLLQIHDPAASFSQGNIIILLEISDECHQDLIQTFEDLIVELPEDEDGSTELIDAQSILHTLLQVFLSPDLAFDFSQKHLDQVHPFVEDE